ncbi:MAG: hypothetical protein A2Z02_05180 [Chloroflexi bacterium RBG_16_48_7]|nr:MAG: hypothetical protein A2Z02_05180 [Chloroflexi bacterium RBG_16_48_7]
MLKIVVCVKQVTDPEAPSSVYKVDPASNTIKVIGVPPAISTFDENAIEASLRIRDGQECQITAVSVGKGLAKNVLMKTLALGFNNLTLVEIPSFNELDSHSSAVVLANTIRKIGDFDLILTGRQAADTNAGIVGPGIAMLLGIPCITEVRKIEINDNTASVEKVLPDGYQVINSLLPCVLTIGSELGTLRTATIQQIIDAKKKPVNYWDSRDLHGSEGNISNMKLKRIFIPEIINKCEFISGETNQEKGVFLTHILHDSGLI